MKKAIAYVWIIVLCSACGGSPQRSTVNNSSKQTRVKKEKIVVTETEQSEVEEKSKQEDSSSASENTNVSTKQDSDLKKTKIQDKNHETKQVDGKEDFQPYKDNTPPNIVKVIDHKLSGLKYSLNMPYARVRDAFPVFYGAFGDPITKVIPTQNHTYLSGRLTRKTVSHNVIGDLVFIDTKISNHWKLWLPSKRVSGDINTATLDQKGGWFVGGDMTVEGQKAGLVHFNAFGKMTYTWEIKPVYSIVRDEKLSRLYLSIGRDQELKAVDTKTFSIVPNFLNGKEINGSNLVLDHVSRILYIIDNGKQVRAFNIDTNTEIKEFKIKVDVNSIYYLALDPENQILIVGGNFHHLNGIESHYFDGLNYLAVSVKDNRYEILKDEYKSGKDLEERYKKLTNTLNESLQKKLGLLSASYSRDAVFDQKNQALIVMGQDITMDAKEVGQDRTVAVLDQEFKVLRKNALHKKYYNRSLVPNSHGMIWDQENNKFYLSHYEDIILYNVKEDYVDELLDYKTKGRFNNHFFILPKDRKKLYVANGGRATDEVDSLFVLNTVDKKITKRWHFGNESEVSALSFNSNGTQLFVGGNSFIVDGKKKNFLIIDLSSNNVVDSFLFKNLSSISAIVKHPKNNKFYIGSQWGRRLYVFDPNVKTMKEVPDLKTYEFRSMVFSKDGKKLYLGGSSFDFTEQGNRKSFQKVCVLNVETGKLDLNFKPPQFIEKSSTEVQSVALSLDEQTLFIGGDFKINIPAIRRGFATLDAKTGKLMTYSR